MVIFRLLLRKFWIQKWFYNCQQSLCLISHCLWVHPRFSWSRKDVGSPKSTSLLSTFHIGWMFCFFPSIYISSTYTDKNGPFSRLPNIHSQFGTFSQPYFNRTFSKCLSHNGPAKGWPYRFRSKETTGSSVLDHDFGHCALVDVSKYLDIPTLEH